MMLHPAIAENITLAIICAHNTTPAARERARTPMPLFRKRLPPLSALVAFEAAARLQSFTRAGPELNVTQAAISRQIAALEKYVGLRMFRRSRRGMMLTDDGRRLYGATSFAFQHLADTVEDLMHGPRPAAISIYASLAFSYFWLIPRLPRFRASFPGTSIQVVSSDEEFDIHKDHCDVAVLFGGGSWPGMEAKLLYQECIGAVAGPAYLRRHGELRTVDDITTGTLLHLEDERRRWVDWGQWLRTMGARSTKSGDCLYFNNYPALLQAAANGQGLALGWHGLIGEMLENGTLVEVLPNRLITNLGYFAAHPTASAMKPEVRALLDWIAAEAREESGSGKGRRNPRHLVARSALIAAQGSGHRPADRIAARR
jgi:DNA-binding transcriptional LysR family regulator